MKNYIGSGDQVTMPVLPLSAGNPLDLDPNAIWEPGIPVLWGDFDSRQFGVLGSRHDRSDIGVDEQVVVYLVGIFDLPCVVNEDVYDGAALFFDDSSGLLTIDDGSGSNVRAGIAISESLAGNDTVRVLIGK